MHRTWKRLAFGLALLATVTAMAALATSSVFAFTIGTDQPSAANGNSPSNTTGSLSALSLRPASSETFTANYLQASTSGAASSIIKTMWQQWRHDQQNDWFYVFAQKAAGATPLATSTWNVYYYVAGRGVTTIAAGVVDSAPTTTSATIYLDSGTGTTNPAFIVDSVTAAAPATCVALTTTCTASFSTTLRWGIAQQGFRAGSMTLLQAVESFSIGTTTVGSPTIYYDAWEAPVAGGANVVALSDRAPTQSTTGVTNASGTRQANLGVPYTMTQTVGDADGDLLSQSLIWVFPSTGQWFEAGIYNGRTTGGGSATTVTGATGNPTTASGFYRDWRTAPTAISLGSSTTIGYFTQLTIGSPVQTTATLNGGAIGVTSQSATYSFIYSATAVGSVNVYGTAGDWHGLWSGMVPVGSQTIS
jgi:hypothetical protein